MPNTGPVVLVDGNNLVARNQHVFDKAVSTKIIDDRFPHGFPVGGIYGMVNMIRAFLAESGAGGVIVAFDAGSPAYRRELCPEYKSQRAGQRTPEDEYNHLAYTAQTVRAHEILTPLGIDVVRAKGWEGDDVIAALATQVLTDREVIIYSSDHDFIPLIDPDHRIRVYDINTKTYSSRDPFYFLKRTMDPKSSDNLDGARGIGTVKADQLVDAWQAEAIPGHDGLEDFIAWCKARIETLPAGTKLRGLDRLCGLVIEYQQKLRANWKCANLHESAVACLDSLRVRAGKANRAIFRARCEEYSLRPLMEESNVLFDLFSRLGAVL